MALNDTEFETTALERIRNLGKLGNTRQFKCRGGERQDQTKGLKNINALFKLYPLLHLQKGSILLCCNTAVSSGCGSICLIVFLASFLTFIYTLSRSQHLPDLQTYLPLTWFTHLLPSPCVCVCPCVNICEDLWLLFENGIEHEPWHLQTPTTNSHMYLQHCCYLCIKAYPCCYAAAKYV